jgi:hypothetical protein
MPRVMEITDEVVADAQALSLGAAMGAPQSHGQSLGRVVGLVGELKKCCDDYWLAMDKSRTTNYEDIAYIARQLSDALAAQYENPALLPLMRRLRRARGGTLGDLAILAEAATSHIEEIVVRMLSRPIGSLEHLTAIANAFRDPTVEQLDLFTLNHDLVIETALRRSAVHFSDGFEWRHGTLLVWNDSYQDEHRRFFKLHGSIDWYRYALPGRAGQVIARSSDDDDPFHPRGPHEEELQPPLDLLPDILTGTFDKILRYPTGIYADQHFRFHEALAKADRLLVIGYGFRDKAINARLVNWCLRPAAERFVIVREDPEEALRTTARGVIRENWRAWQESGLLKFVPHHLDHDTTWQEIRAQLI